jgi:hypothetical protein
MRTYQKWTTPVGIARWPRLNEPDTAFNADGDFKVTLEFRGAEAKKVMGEVKVFAKAAYTDLCREHGKKTLKAAALPAVEEGDVVLLKAKLRHRVDGKAGAFTQRVALFDSSGRPLPEGAPVIGAGSRMRAAVEVVPYYTALMGAGITLRLRGVQIVELVEYNPGAATAAALGFGRIESGWSAQPEEFTLEESSDEASIDSADGSTESTEF